MLSSIREAALFGFALGVLIDLVQADDEVRYVHVTKGNYTDRQLPRIHHLRRSCCCWNVMDDRSCGQSGRSVESWFLVYSEGLKMESIDVL